MRVVYLVLIGLIVFQAMLFFTAPFFKTPTYGVNVTESEIYEGYNLSAGSVVWNLLWGENGMGGVAGVVIGLIGIGGFLWSGNTIVLGIGAFLGIVSTLYINSYYVLSSVVAGFGNWYVQSIIALIGVLIAILAIFIVVETTMQQQGANT